MGIYLSSVESRQDFATLSRGTAHVWQGMYLIYGIANEKKLDMNAINFAILILNDLVLRAQNDDAENSTASYFKWTISRTNI